MELTRRDAVAALAALGTAGGAAAYGRQRPDDGTGSDDTSGVDGSSDDTSGDAGSSDDGAADGPALGVEEAVALYTAVAAVVYPSEVTGVEAFVGAFLPARLDRADHGEAMIEAATRLDDLAREWHGGAVADLSPSTRDSLLREIGADTAEADPEGTFAERVRFYVVNELLLALYSSPTGGELVGIENPQGHPGGTDSYRRGPPG